MAFLALQAADVFYGDFFAGAVFEFFVVAFVLFVVSVVFEFDLRLAVAIDAPAHAECGILIYNLHLLDGAMAFLTFYLADCDVLRVVKIDVIGQVVDAHPFDGALNFAVGIVSQRFHDTFPLIFNDHAAVFVECGELLFSHVFLANPPFVEVFDLFFAPRVVAGYVLVGDRVEADGGVDFGDFGRACFSAFFHC